MLKRNFLERLPQGFPELVEFLNQGRGEGKFSLLAILQCPEDIGRRLYRYIQYLIHGSPFSRIYGMVKFR